MIVSALSNCFCNLLTSLSNSMTLRASGLTGFAFLPRLFGARPSSSAFSLCLRHVARWEEYRPSRLSRAPTAPGLPLQASASSRIFFLYCAENLLLRALTGTSGSGLPSALRRAQDTAGSGHRSFGVRRETTPTIGGPRGSLRSGSLRSPPLRDPLGIVVPPSSTSTTVSSPALAFFISLFLSRPLFSTLICHGVSVQSL